jgi:FAM192A/Fyv6, N-terminal domain
LNAKRISWSAGSSVKRSGNESALPINPSVSTSQSDLLESEIYSNLILVVPEEPFDGRSLYDRLKEQRDAKDLEFEESRKFKNMIRGLDDDEVDHLSEVDSR